MNQSIDIVDRKVAAHDPDASGQSQSYRPDGDLSASEHRAVHGGLRHVFSDLLHATTAPGIYL
jgi:hypothetical protein